MSCIAFILRSISWLVWRPSMDPGRILHIQQIIHVPNFFTWSNLSYNLYSHHQVPSQQLEPLSQRSRQQTSENIITYEAPPICPDLVTWTSRSSNVDGGRTFCRLYTPVQFRPLAMRPRRNIRSQSSCRDQFGCWKGHRTWHQSARTALCHARGDENMRDNRRGFYRCFHPKSDFSSWLVIIAQFPNGCVDAILSKQNKK